MPGSDATAPIKVDRLLGGRYRLISPIARGGMAEVWQGRDEVLSRPVAVKVLQAHLATDGTFVERFRREAIAAARLTHPGVVATFDTGTDAGTAWIVMELITGKTLRQLLNERGPMTPALAVDLTTQIADALAHAHRAGLIHRDIKPANILLVEEDGAIRAKVTDFGIAKATKGLGLDLTRTGIVLGTPKYLSPEQVEGHEPDARADLYSLGVVLFEMLTGRPPFEGTTEMATAIAHVRQPAPRVSSLRPDISPDLDDVVANLLAKNPGERIATALALRNALATMNLRPPLRRNPQVPPPGSSARVVPGAGVRGAELQGAGVWGPDPTVSESAPSGTAAGADADARRSPFRPGRPPLDTVTNALNGGVGRPSPSSDRSTGRPPGSPTSATRVDLPVRPAGTGSSASQLSPGVPLPSWPPTTNVATAGLPAPIAATAGAPREALGRPPLGEESTGSVKPPRRGRRRRWAPALVVAVLVIGGSVVGVELLNIKGLPNIGTRGTQAETTPATISDVSVWMMNGRPADNPGQTRNTFDGNPSTTWSTDLYRTLPFGGYYTGIGLAIHIAAARSLHELKVTSPTRGWSAQTYVEGTLPSSGQAVTVWGPLTATRTDVTGSTTFDLGNKSGSWVLLWLTNPGPAGLAQVSELSVS